MKHITDIGSSLSSVLDGNPTEEEKKQVDTWIAEKEENKLFFEQLRQSDYKESIEKAATLRKENIYIATQVKIQKASFVKKVKMWQTIAAASVCLMVLLGVSYLNQTVNREPIVMETKCPAGNITTVTLSDGTRVDLNASSMIRYPLYFDGKTRSVSLDGEACFEVVKNTKQPFIVKANGMHIEVLGTRFNISSYSDDEQTITTLLEGSVQVEIDHLGFAGKKPIKLTPDQQIIYNKTTQKVRVTDVKGYLYAAWKDGQCYFENEKFSDIVKKLERQFGVSITILSPELNNEMYSGFFSKKEGVRQILNSFKKYRNFDYREDDELGIEIFKAK